MSEYTPTNDRLVTAYVDAETKRNKYKGEEFYQSPSELAEEALRAIAAIKAEAWDEGHAGHSCYGEHENPYRAAGIEVAG